MMTGPSANSPRYSASNEPSAPASPSPTSRSTEINPYTSENLLDPAAASHGLQQLYRDAKPHHRKSDSSMPRDNNDNFATTQTLDRSRSDVKECSRSPKKNAESWNGLQNLEVKKERNPYGHVERGDRSPSPRKRKGEIGIRQEVGVSGQTSGSGTNKDRRYKEDTQRQDRETGETKPEVARGSSDRYQRDHMSGTLNRKDQRENRLKGSTQEALQDTTSKKAPITPGPWKVPSSARVQPPVHGV